MGVAAVRGCIEGVSCAGAARLGQTADAWLASARNSLERGGVGSSGDFDVLWEKVKPGFGPLAVCVETHASPQQGRLRRGSAAVGKGPHGGGTRPNGGDETTSDPMG